MTGVETVIAGAVIGPIIKNLIDGSGKALKGAFSKWNSNTALKNIEEKIQSIGKVKTIWSPDESVSVNSFYYRSKIKNAEINSIKKFSEKNVIIEGLIGQGKSILLRHLCVQEITSEGAGKIPVFVELKHIRQNKDLNFLINSELESFGLEINDEIFNYLANSGKIVILLDAFDEISEGFENTTVHDIERLCKNHPKLQFIITSRPASGIQSSTYFDVKKVDFLKEDDYAPFLRALHVDQAKILDICDAIKNSPNEISKLISTPLMLTLVLFVYSNNTYIPESIPEFFDSLFGAVFNKHDRMKAGFSRKHKSGLQQTELQELFEHFCILAAQDNSSSLTHSQFANNFKEVISADADLKCKTDDFKFDIVNVACLMLDDGNDRISFLHKSIMEYFAAAFIKNSPDTVAIEFYAEARKNFLPWKQILNFLEKIDRYRYYKNFLIPNCKHILDEIGFGQTGASDEDIIKYSENNFGHISVRFDLIDKTGEYEKIGHGPYANSRQYYGEFYSIVIESIFDLISTHTKENYTKKEVTFDDTLFTRSTDSSEIFSVSLKNILRTYGSSDVIKNIRYFEQNVHLAQTKAVEFVQKQDGKKAAIKKRIIKKSTTET